VRDAESPRTKQGALKRRVTVPVPLFGPSGIQRTGILTQKLETPLASLLIATAGARRRFLKPMVVMPAYNAEQTLEATVRDVPTGCVDSIILVDDASRDGTVALAERLGLTVIRHPETRGYGANQKSCYAEALRRGADAVVMVHPDYQYDAFIVRPALDLLASGCCDVVLGNRIRSRKAALESRMPIYKYLSNRVLTFVENSVLGQNLGDCHSGFRAYTRDVLEAIPYERNSDDFVFDTQMIAQAAWFGFQIGDLPVPCRYFAEASSINLWRSIVYGCATIGVMSQFLLQKAHLARFGIFQRAQPRMMDRDRNDNPI